MRQIVGLMMVGWLMAGVVLAQDAPEAAAKERVTLTADMDAHNAELIAIAEAKTPAEIEAVTARIRETYMRVDFHDHKMTAVKFKENLRNRCEVLNQVLTISDVRLPATHKHFGTEHFLRPQVIPSRVQIAEVLTLMRLYDGMVDVMCRSRITAIERWRFTGEIKDPQPTEATVGELPCEIFGFALSVTGDAASLQRLLVKLGESGAFFVVRGMSVTDDPPTANAVQVNGEGPTTLHLRIDYIQFPGVGTAARR